MTVQQAATTSGLMLRRPIVLIGLMGAGKSKIGRQLSLDFGIEFIDTDDVIENVAGMDISSIFELYGEDRFREIETREIKRLVEDKPAILSTGGGAYIRKENRDVINAAALSVWLQAEPETLAGRISNTDSRPLLKGKDPVQVLTKLAAERNPIYAEAEVVINTDGLSLKQAIEKVKSALTSYINDETAENA